MSFLYIYDESGIPVAAKADPITVPGFQTGIQPVYLLNGGAGGTASSFDALFPTTGTAAGASDGTNMKPLKVDGSGNLLIAGSLTVAAVTSTTASAASQQTIGTAAVTALAANASRKRVMLQNCGTTVIKIVLGAGTPTQNDYHFDLPACGSANDGSSPIWRDEMWLGVIKAISSASGGLLQVTELT